MLTRLLALGLLLALPASTVPVAAWPQDCVSNQPFQADDPDTFWRFEDRGGSFVAGVRDDVYNHRWELVTNDCELLSLTFACNAVSDIDPSFPAPACHVFAGLLDTILYDGYARVYGTAYGAGDAVLLGVRVCDFTTSYQGFGPWSCKGPPPEQDSPVLVVIVPVPPRPADADVAVSERDTTVTVTAGDHTQTVRVPAGASVGPLIDAAEGLTPSFQLDAGPLGLPVAVPVPRLP